MRLILAAILTLAVIATAENNRVCPPPSDLRDAVSDASAREQLGLAGEQLAGAGMPYVPEPEAVEVNNGKSSPRAGKRNAERPMSDTFTTDDIMGLLASTGAGSDLLGYFQMGEAELPEIIHQSRLTDAEQEMLRGASFRRKEAYIALFIKSKDFRNNRSHIILFKSGWPLFVTACIAAHELQHAVDRNAPWSRHINAVREEARIKLDKANSRGFLMLEDFALEDRGYGLNYVNTFFTEYLAYSRSASVFEGLAKNDPEIRGRLANLKEMDDDEKSQMELNPLNDPRDRREFMEIYFWPGNRPRFKAGIAAVLADEKLLAELRAAGLDTAVSELAAFNASPDPVYKPAHSLRELDAPFVIPQ